MRALLLTCFACGLVLPSLSPELAATLLRIVGLQP